MWYKIIDEFFRNSPYYINTPYKIFNISLNLNIDKYLHDSFLSFSRTIKHSEQTSVLQNYTTTRKKRSTNTKKKYVFARTMVEILSIKFIRSKNCSRMVTESMLEHLTLDDSCVDHQRSGSDRYLIPCVNTSREWDSLFSFISRVAIIERVIRNGQSSSFSREIFRFLIAFLLSSIYDSCIMEVGFIYYD